MGIVGHRGLLAAGEQGDEPRGPRFFAGARADGAVLGLRTVVVLLAAGRGFALMATDAVRRSSRIVLAFTLGWDGPGLFNLAVVDAH